MKRILWMTLPAVAMAVLCVVLIHKNKELEQSTQERDALKLERLKEASKPAPPSRPVREAAATMTPAQPSGVEQIKPPVSKPFQTGFGTNFMSAIAGLMKNPYMKETMKVQQKVMVDKMYGDLLKSLTNLTDEQKKQFHEMLVERQQFMAEAGIAMMGGTPEEKKKAMDLMKDAKAGYEQVVNDLFGAETAETFKQYEDRMPEHTSLSMFKGSLPAADAMSAQQESDLVAALYQERKNMPADSLMNKQRGQVPDPSQMTEEKIAQSLQQMEQLQQRSLARAETILTPAQLEQFKQYQKQTADMQAIGLKMAAQMFSTKAAATSSAP